MEKGYKVVLFFGVALAVVGSAYAQFAKPEDAIRYRTSVMFMISHHFKSIGAVVQDKAEFDQEKIASEAQTLAFLATLPWEAMTAPGSGKGETTISPDVFSKTNQFNQRINDFETATQKLAIAAETGELDKIKEQFNVVAGNCKNCHGQFRKK
jgi:cytochrome c556